MPANTVNGTVEGSSGDTVLNWIIYRNGTLAAYAQARDPYYEDCGVTIPGSNFPSYVPTSPGSAVNKALVTTVVSGGGTTNIVVANAAGNTISGQTALHDNSQNLRAALAAGAFNTPVRLNPGAVFNAPTLFDGSHGGNAQLWLPSRPTANPPQLLRPTL